MQYRLFQEGNLVETRDFRSYKVQGNQVIIDVGNSGDELGLGMESGDIFTFILQNYITRQESTNAVGDFLYTIKTGVMGEDRYDKIEIYNNNALVFQYTAPAACPYGTSTPMANQRSTIPIYCRNCGQSITGLINIKFCPYCGVTLDKK